MSRILTLLRAAWHPDRTGDGLDVGQRLPAQLRGLITLTVLLLWGLTAGDIWRLTQQSATHADDAEALRMVGRQALLAQRLVAQTSGLAPADARVETMTATLQTMMDEALRLPTLRPSWSLPEDAPDHWTSLRERLWQSAQGYLTALDEAHPELAQRSEHLRTQAEQLLPAIDRALQDMQGLADAHQARLKREHLRDVLLLAAAAGLLAWGLGEPLARRARRQAQRLAEQTAQLERLALVADRTQNAVMLLDPDGHIQWINEAFTRMSGHAPPQAIGRHPQDLLRHPEAPASTRLALDAAIRSGLPLQAEQLHRHAGGRAYWVELGLQPLRNPHGALTGFIAVETDITEHVQRRDELAAIFETLPAGVVVQGPDGRITEANAKAQELLGLSRAQLLGVDSLDPRWASLHEDGSPLPGDQHPSMRTLRDGQPRTNEVMGVLLPSGERRWLRVNTQRLERTDGEVTGVLSCFLDETEVRSQRNLLRLTITGAGLGTWLWDVASGRLEFNERWAEMLGYIPDQVPSVLSEWETLLHPDDRLEARTALQRHLRHPATPYRTEFRIRNAAGEWSWIMAAGSVIDRTTEGRARRVAGVHADITTRKRLEQALSDAALTDALTQLPNRSAMQQALAACLARQQSGTGRPFAVLFMDFDRFKLVNDSLGHEVGDKLLRQIAARLRAAVRPNDDIGRLGPAEPQLAGRLGGDEFVVLLEGLPQAGHAMTVAERLLQTLAAPYDLNGHRVQSTASIGVVVCEAAGSDVESLLRDADTAMYEAKRRGRGRAVLFTPDMHERIRHALDLEGDMRQGLRGHEFFPVYQPIVDMVTGRTVSLEALARWKHPLRGLVSPLEFIPLAEDNGLIVALGEHMLRQACQDLARWQVALGDAAPRSVSVNLSRAQLEPAVLPATVARALADSGLPARSLRLEVTESLAMQDEAAIAVLHALKALGVTLSLDDFGTGYSSLASLDQLPIDTVKIDRSFVDRMLTHPYPAALVRSTAQVAEALHLNVIAEGVETPAQAEALQRAGVRLGQGYLFSRPLPAAALPGWLQEQADTETSAKARPVAQPD